VDPKKLIKLIEETRAKQAEVNDAVDKIIEGLYALDISYPLLQELRHASKHERRPEYSVNELLRRFHWSMTTDDDGRPLKRQRKTKEVYGELDATVLRAAREAKDVGVPFRGSIAARTIGEDRGYAPELISRRIGKLANVGKLRRIKNDHFEFRQSR
jgi:hypothetical protein